MRFVKQGDMRFFEKRYQRHTGNKAANMGNIGNAAAGLAKAQKLQRNPAAQHNKGRHIDQPEENKYADNAAHVMRGCSNK